MRPGEHTGADALASVPGMNAFDPLRALRSARQYPLLAVLVVVAMWAPAIGGSGTAADASRASAGSLTTADGPVIRAAGPAVSADARQPTMFGAARSGAAYDADRDRAADGVPFLLALTPALVLTRDRSDATCAQRGHHQRSRSILTGAPRAPPLRV